MEKAGWFSRFVAYIIDSIIIGVIGTIIAYVATMAIGGLTVDQNSTFFSIFYGIYMITWLVIIALSFIYFGYFWSSDSGSSLGMKVVNIKVVRRKEGEGVNFWRAGLRGTFGYWVSGFIFGLGYLWALWDAQKETWHDKIFDTWVVKS